MANYHHLAPVYTQRSPSAVRPPAPATYTVMGDHMPVARTLTFAEAQMQNAAGQQAGHLINPYQQFHQPQPVGTAYPYAGPPTGQMPMAQYAYIQVQLRIACIANACRLATCCKGARKCAMLDMSLPDLLVKCQWPNTLTYNSSCALPASSMHADLQHAAKVQESAPCLT